METGKIILLYDGKPWQHFIKQGLERLGYQAIEMYDEGGLRNKLSGIRGAFKAIMSATRNDIIVCWFDLQAVFCYVLSKIFFRPRKIVALNIMLKDTDSIKTKLLAKFYSRAFRDKNFRASVTSNKYGENLNRRLGTNIRFELIRDVVRDDNADVTPFRDRGKTVFCGGHNGRDWKKVYEVAKLLPDFKFTVVCPDLKLLASDSDSPLLPNLDIYADIPYAEFQRLQAESTFVMLPLISDSPAGLLVIFDAARYGNVVVANSNSVIDEYLADNKGVIINGGGCLKTLPIKSAKHRPVWTGWRLSRRTLKNISTANAPNKSS